MKKFLAYTIYLCAILGIPSGCDRSSYIDLNDDNIENRESHEEDNDYVWDETNITLITLEESYITVQGDGATVSGSTVIINKGGYFKVTGSLNDGQLRVKSADSEVVHIQLDGAIIKCSNNAPLYIEQSGKTIIMLNESSTNSLTDGSSYGNEEDVNAALFSKSNLTLFGKGTLDIEAQYNDGITSKDGLIINGGTYNIKATDDAIRGKDYLIIKNGNFDIDAGGDGFKSDNEERGFGYITIDYCESRIIAGGDAIQAYNNLYISKGIYNIKCAGGVSGYLSYDASAKGIKAGLNLQIDDGTFEISAPDDAVHSNEAMIINGGTFTIATGDDAFHADISLELNDGYSFISQCYEGIESAKLTVNGGTTIIHSSDDGINAADGTGEGGFGMAPGNCTLNINGGYLVAYTSGDGIDINGSVEMTAGTLIIHGPTANNNGALDYDGNFRISGGFIVAAGSSGMAQIPGTSSSQASILINFTSSYQANTLFNLQSENGEEIVTFKPSKTYQSVAISSPELIVGSNYKVYINGLHDGSEQEGIYNDGNYTPGDLYTSFTLNSVATIIGNTGGGAPPPPR